MYICYVDESGGFEAPNSSSGAAPLMTIVGLVVPTSAIAALTAGFLALKRRFFPGRTKRRLDDILTEIKGSDLRYSVRAGSTREYRHAIGVLAGVIGLIELHDIRLLGRVWVKASTSALDPDATYTFAIQDISRHFEHFLRTQNANGLVVCDARGHGQDMRVAHSVFTLKHQSTGDTMPRLIETPTFAKSNNHAGIQLADIVASALLFPMATRVYCPASAGDPHSDPEYDQIRLKFAKRLRARQYLYVDAEGRTRGGIVVSDQIGQQPSRALFIPPTPQP